MYKIKLSNPILLFAVETNDKRWRFRIDDVGCFEYVANENSCEHHVFLKLICGNIEDKSIRNCIHLLIKHAEQLKNEENPNYIKALISEIEQKVSTI